jgi:hypothetical protein
MSHLEKDRVITQRVGHPFAGILSQKGPDNPYRLAGSEANTLSTIRSVTSKLGFVVEHSALKILTGEIPKQTNNAILINALKGVRDKLKPITERTINTHAKISTYYQQLSEPPEIPFIGDERTWPSFEPLRTLFEETDNVFGTDFTKTFAQIGSFYGEIDPIIRYYVEGAEMLASLATEELRVVDGQILPNVWLVKNGKSVTQFDGIIIPKEFESQEEGFEFNNFLFEDLPWGVIQVKTNFRARFVSGKNKIKKPFTRDESEFQQQLAKCILANGDFHFPTFIQYYYCRGTNQTVTHLKRLDRTYFDNWLGVLEHNIKNNLVENDLQKPAQQLLRILIDKRDSFPSKKTIIYDSSTNGYVQSDLEGF